MDIAALADALTTWMLHLGKSAAAMDQAGATTPLQISMQVGKLRCLQLWEMVFEGVLVLVR